MKHLFNKVPILLIRTYQIVYKKRKPKCLHYPSCSNYGVLAYQKYTIFVATKKTINRIRGCHPLSDRPYIDYP
ncbi:membrane protein insertion efficiency factor YidD [Tumebacillus permanentifrigoris]|uniref:membrane protein insertion efficiency factor YidD n=1 Tax=Tumebacillus permanentifrigoris TaxID=378543 RepID=UPI000D6A8501